MTEAHETNAEGKPSWQEVAAASAEAQKPKDPTERHFTEILPVPLSAEERLSIQDKRNAEEVALERLEADWKTKKELHKAAVAEKKNAISGYAQQLRDKVVTKPVKCVEYTSFATNARWRVRTDTGVEIGREAIPAEERQQLLYPDDPEDGQIVEQGGDGDEDGGDPGGEDPGGAADEGDDGPTDSTTNITDPDTILSGAHPDDPPKRTRRRRS